MKTMKKLASVALALVMVLCLTAPAFAAEITINEPAGMPEEATYNPEYTAYKILDAEPLGETSETANGETISSFKNVAYSIAKDSPFHGVIENFEENGTKVFNVYSKNGTHDVVTLAEGVTTFDAAALATELKAVIDSKPEGLGNYTTEFTGANATLTDGYFLIISSLGSKMIIDTFGKEDMTINTKNDLPTLDKDIIVPVEGAAEGTTQNVDATTASYGDTITFELTVTVPATAVGEMVAHDKMDKGLTYAGWIEIGGVTATTSTEDDCTVEFVISAETVAANLGGTIKIQYTATLDSDAPINVAIKNTAHLTYANYETPKSEVEVKSFSFNLVKVNSDNVILSGAEFKLYDAATEGNEIAVVVDGDGYRVATGEEIGVVIEAGNVTIKGLAEGTYYLEETKAPAGYNKLTTRQEVVVGAESVGTVNTKTNEETNITNYVAEDSVATAVLNLTGAELPSTGGIGTTIFYIVGGILVVGAGILLVTKKRVGEED